MPNPKVGLPVPPVALDQIPKTVIRALDVSTVLSDALIATKHPAIYGPIIALGSLESYYNAARREQHRIAKARITIWKYPKHRDSSLFHDIHFYLICWARIAKLARFIADKTRFRRIGLVLRRYATELKERVDGRDHLEHFEERLPGGLTHGKLRIPNDLINMTNDYLTYGGRKLDVGSASLRLLRTIIKEFRIALLYDSIEALAAAEPRRLSALLKAATSSIQLVQVTKKVERLLKEAV